MSKHDLIQPDRGQPATPIRLVDKKGLEDFVKGLSTPQRAALAAQKFEGDGYAHAIVPDGDGWFVIAGVADPANLSSWCLAKLADVLPAGTYRLAEGDPGPALFGWITGQYRFDRYKADKPKEGPRVLLTTEVKAIDAALAEAAATALVRDLVNTPAEDMGPAELEAQAEALQQGGQHDLPGRDIQTELRAHVVAHGAQEHAAHDDPARIKAFHQSAHHLHAGLGDLALAARRGHDRRCRAGLHARHHHPERDA